MVRKSVGAGRDGDGSAIGSNGGSSHMIIPRSGESLNERIEEALAIKVAEGEIIDKTVGNMYIIYSRITTCI